MDSDRKAPLTVAYRFRGKSRRKSSIVTSAMRFVANRMPTERKRRHTAATINCDLKVRSVQAKRKQASRCRWICRLALDLVPLYACPPPCIRYIGLHTAVRRASMHTHKGDLSITRLSINLLSRLVIAILNTGSPFIWRTEFNGTIFLNLIAGQRWCSCYAFE